MNYESLTNLLENYSCCNCNLKAIKEKIPDIIRYWSTKNQSFTLANIVSSSSTIYNPDTATIPGFSLISNRNAAMLTSNNISTFNRYEGNVAAGTHHIYNDISNVNFTNSFLTPALKFSTFSNFDMIYLALSDRSWGANGYTSQPPSQSGVNLLLSVTASIVFAIFTGSTMNFNTFVNNVSINNVTLSSSGIDRFFCIACDGFNYWIGVSTTINDPIFVWTKITNATNLPTSALSFTLGAARYNTASQGTGTIDITCSAWTGALPWN